MTTLATDPRITMWRQRAAAQDKLAGLRLSRAAICGCGHCDEPDPAVIDKAIRDEMATVTWLSERLSTRPTQIERH